MKTLLIIATGAAFSLTGAALAEGDAAEGEKLFKKCRSCHTISNGDEVIFKGGKTGPNLYAVIGRVAGSTKFKYSKSMIAAGEGGLIWTEDLIAEYVADPSAFLKTTMDDSKAKSKMALKLKKGGADVAAYLASVSPEIGPAWESLPPLAGGSRQEHPVVALAGEIYVLAGFNGVPQIVVTVEAYDPVANTWRTNVASINDGVMDVPMHHANVAVAGGKIYIVGFLTGNLFTPDGRVFEYDPGLNTWTQKTSMPAGTERGGSQVAAIGNIIYVAGGLRGGTVTDFSSYDTVGDTWDTTLPNLPAPLDHGAAGVVGGTFYVLGGRADGITGLSAAVYAFDPAAATPMWLQKTDMPTARGGVAGAVLNGLIYVMGGEGNPAGGTGGVFDDNEVYDPANDAWSVLAPMADPRHGMGAAALVDRIYVPGGGDQQAFGAVDRFDAYVP